VSQLISKLMDIFCAPIVNRVSRQLSPMLSELRKGIQSIQTLHHRAEPPLLPLLIRSELEHIEHLPLPYLRKLTNLVIVGYCGEEVAATIPGARFLHPPLAATTEIPAATLVFLNEYHVLSLLRQVTAFPVFRGGMLLIPFAGNFIEETSLRRILHELGHIEICWIDYDRTDQSLAISGISHPEPISCTPTTVTSSCALRGRTRWLRASSTVLESGDVD
jgi:hypothetical protein